LLRLDPNVAIRMGLTNAEQRLPMPTRSFAEVEGIGSLDEDEIFEAEEAKKRDPIRRLLNASSKVSTSSTDC